MSELTTLEIDATTGEIIERAFTAEELEQREADLAEITTQQEQQEAKAAARASALAKLKKLGLTEKEIAAL